MSAKVHEYCGSRLMRWVWPWTKEQSTSAIPAISHLETPDILSGYGEPKLWSAPTLRVLLASNLECSYSTSAPSLKSGVLLLYECS
jgi:hypothetical protein